MEDRGNATHKLHVDNRNRIMLTGVTDVISFDDKLVMLDTVQGILSIRGEGLKVDRLTIENGEAGIEGKVYNLEYADSREERVGSFFGRLFK
ncbi:MAG: sporulation protein YabP [Lachnospiraceae bacterium]|nr:sporulation protein YabP [Lachnospiraceae bacterium]